MSNATDQTDSVDSSFTESKKVVQFINSEVLNPPKQGDLSFVKPFADQVGVMALEDARSFLQGVEQVLLVFIAKALEKVLAEVPAPKPMAPQTSDISSKSAGEHLAAAESLLTVLPRFYESLAGTAMKLKAGAE